MNDKKKTILLVENEANIALAEAEVLKKDGYSVVTVIGGEDAIERVIQKDGIDLIVMDINLGRRMNGTEAAEIILDGRGIPVVFLARGTRTFDLNSLRNVVAAVDDVTDSNKVEEKKDKVGIQLLQTEKIEPLSQLAGGMARDFTNLLSVIGTFSYILHNKTEDDSPLRVYINQIDKAVKKGADLINGMLAHSRIRQVNGKLVYLNKIVKDAKNGIKTVIGEDIEVREIVTEQPLIIRADSMQIHQMLLDLVTNARDAMPEGCTLTISTGLMETNDEFIRTHGDAKSAAYALISVEDTGKGMDEGTKEKIFKPVVTNRKKSNEAGITLSTVCGIVWQHNGYIDIHSEPGRGTTFRIYFPIIDMQTLEEMR